MQCSPTRCLFSSTGLSGAVEFLQSCQLGQTERGSFVVKIMAPVPPQINHQITFLPPDDAAFIASEPFVGNPTVTLMTGLRHIRGAIDSGHYEEILTGVDAGVSANLCEAIASMQPDGDQAQLHIRMSWSPSRPKLPTAVENSVGFRKRHSKSSRRLDESSANTRPLLDSE